MFALLIPINKLLPYTGDAVNSGVTRKSVAYQAQVGSKQFTWQKGWAWQRLNKCAVSSCIDTLIVAFDLGIWFLWS
jgi:hypothetical protein